MDMQDNQNNSQINYPVIQSEQQIVESYRPFRTSYRYYGPRLVIISWSGIIITLIIIGILFMMFAMID